MKKIYRNDLILLGIILLLCAVMPVSQHLSKEASNKTAVISHDGHIVCEIDIADEGYFEVNGVFIEVKNMSAKVKKSTCPDGLCMGMKSAKNVGDSIICVPNKVSVKIVSDSKNEEDVVIAG